MTPEETFDLGAAKKLICDRIREATLDMRVSSEQLSESAGYSANYLRRLRTDSTRNVTVAGLWKLAKALDVNPHWLLGAPYVTKHMYTHKISERNEVLVNDVIDKASELFCVHRRDIAGPYRYGFLMPARFALCKALRERGLSYPHIGRIMNRDHSTIIHAVERAEYTMERDSGYAEKVQTLIDLRPAPAEKEEANG